MAIPTKPYSVSSQVGLLLNPLMNNSLDFTENTTPKKSAVDQYLVWISNQIDLQFAQAGYIVPFQILDGESWYEHQTMYLELVCALGAAALAGGHVLKPAPALSPGRGNSSGNIYQDLYNTELTKIYDRFTKQSTVRFRAKAFSGTPAEYSIREPVGPNLDYIAGKMHAEDFIGFQAYTDLKYNIQWYMENNFDSIVPLDWTDFHGLIASSPSGYSYVG